MYMVDTMDVKAAERRLNTTITSKEIEMARENDGWIAKVVRGKVYYIRFKLLKFPMDLMTSEQKQNVRGGFFEQEDEN